MLNCAFASDTMAPVCDEAISMMNEVNVGYELGYFEDEYTSRVREIMQGYFTKQVGIYFCTSGTASNVLAMKIMKNNYSSIITTEYAHAVNYEAGAVEYNTGCKLIPCKTVDGKLTMGLIDPHLKTRNSRNWSNPEIVMLTQSTEFGTCYTLDELKLLTDFCHKNGLYVYVDGARLANAMEYMKCGFKEILEDTGVDVASFGINKNGAMFGEMLIILNPKFDNHLIKQQKQSMQLFSKTRFMSAQFLALLKEEKWRANAKNANNMARYLETEMKKLGFYTVYPVESNCVFYDFSDSLKNHIKQMYKLSSYEDQAYTRLMTTWCTTPGEIDDFINYVKKFD